MSSTVPTTGSRTTSPVSAATTKARGSFGAAAATRGWKPKPDDLVDACALLALSALAAFGLTRVYDGLGVMAVALFATVVGFGVAWASAVRRLSPLATLGLALGAFVACSGPALPDAAIAGVLPGPRVPADLLAGLVDSWKDLLTTAPPVALDGGLGVVPYVGGFLAGVVGGLLAWRTPAPLLAALGPMPFLVGSFLFGERDPRNVAVQGGGYLVVSLAWAAQRANRAHRSTDGIYWPRVWGSVVMLALLAPIGYKAGGAMPFTGGERTVLREEVIPPWNAADYPSPLAGLRAYRKAPDDRDRTFLEVEGLGKGDLIRVATMDTYNGVVWTVSGDDHDGSGVFKRVGAKINPEPPWDPADIEITIPEGGYTGVWVPSVGALRSIAFTGTEAAKLADTFRYNPATGTAAAIYQLGPGNRYRLDVRVAPDLRSTKDGEAALRADTTTGLTPSYPDELAEHLTELGERAESFVGDATSAYDKVVAIEQGLQDNFYFSDDLKGAPGTADVAAGHSIFRLNALLQQRAGNAEQYAAAMALMVQRIGLPSRVVMGFAPEEAGKGKVEVKGTDATAWVEVEFAEHGWVPFFPTPSEDPPEAPPPLPEQNPREQQPIPPVTYVEPPPTVPPEQPRDEEEEPVEPPDENAASGVPRWVRVALTYGGPPLIVVGGTLIAIVGLKAARRRRRRTKGSVVEQINGAWQEAVDRLRDMGHRPSPSATRRELAGAAATGGVWPGGLAFADTIDAHMFGPTDPAAPSAEATWTDLDEHVKALHAPLTRRQRLRAAVSTASLRRGKPMRLGEGGGALAIAGRSKGGAAVEGDSLHGSRRLRRTDAAPSATVEPGGSVDGSAGLPESQRVPTVPAVPAGPSLAGETRPGQAQGSETASQSVDGQEPIPMAEPLPDDRPRGQ